MILEDLGWNPERAAAFMSCAGRPSRLGVHGGILRVIPLCRSAQSGEPRVRRNRDACVQYVAVHCVLRPTQRYDPTEVPPVVNPVHSLALSRDEMNPRNQLSRSGIRYMIRELLRPIIFLGLAGVPTLATPGISSSIPGLGSAVRSAAGRSRCNARETGSSRAGSRPLRL